MNSEHILTLDALAAHFAVSVKTMRARLARHGFFDNPTICRRVGRRWLFSPAARDCASLALRG